MKNHIKMLRAFRKAEGLSQKELADKLKVTQGRISKVENGLLPDYPFALLLDLAKLYKFKLDDFKELAFRSHKLNKKNQKLAPQKYLKTGSIKIHIFDELLTRNYDLAKKMQVDLDLLYFPSEKVNTTFLMDILKFSKKMGIEKELYKSTSGENKLQLQELQELIETMDLFKSTDYSIDDNIISLRLRHKDNINTDTQTVLNGITLSTIKNSFKTELTEIVEDTSSLSLKVRC